MFESPGRLLLGFATGLAFGFLLQTGGVAKYRVIMGQLLLKDWTVAKIMGSAIAVGAIGVYAMQSVGWVQLEIKPAAFGALLGGGLLFGIGMAVVGLCPGTTVAACGEGRRDAIAAVGGMLFGAGVFVPLYTSLQRIADVLGNWGKVTLPDVTRSSPWIWVSALVLAAAAGFYLLERVQRRSGGEQPSG
jgi:uncharacterized protein